VTASRRIDLGSVVWAEVKDPNGISKVRPTVVVTSSAAIANGEPVRVVAITTRLPHPLPSDHILLPWDRQGTARSGLRKKCVAVTSWIAELSVAEIRDVVGILPPTVTKDILTQIASAADVAAKPQDGNATSAGG
jgi:mRNA-degrading endonuclease toxin of MazEF toxin-antitoxin module